ncbi:MAG: choice-of-anchor L domain-containing protein [Saprospiraceae bacterium]|nr:choice-of-anchor L domain-containing protein [Saprospiraceae bacterium]
MRFVGYVLGGALCLSSVLVFAQLEVTPMENTERLIRDNFIKISQCIDDGNVSNFRAIGDKNVIGSFSGGEEVLGMSEGIVFSTGFLEDVLGPNDETGRTGVTGSQVGERDLRKVSRSGQIYDAAGIEFDFIPITDVVTFNYLFASEEYCEYVGSEFNDVFGFFVSGPGIDGDFENSAENVAKIPFTGEGVTINNVNHRDNENYFVANFLQGDVMQCGIENYREPTKNIQFDGYTRKLTATIEVIPCQTYHIKLVVGDVSDQFLDSAVFLEANSFDLGKILETSLLVDGKRDTLVYEACQEVELLFEGPLFKGFTEEKRYNYALAGSATEGLDYVLGEGEIVIPAGLRSTSFGVDIQTDDLTEGTERLYFIVEFPTCDCIRRDTTLLYISDPNTGFTASFDSIQACLRQDILLSPMLMDGVGPYKYHWSTNDTMSSLLVAVDGEKDIMVEVRDACGGVDTALAEVRLQEVPVAEITGDAFWCNREEPLLLDIALPGNAPWTLEYSIEGVPQPPIEEILEPNFQLPLSRPGAYQLLSFSDEYCTGLTSGSVSVDERVILYDIAPAPTTCLIIADGSAEIAIIEGIDVEISWQDPNLTGLEVNNLEAGLYPFVLEDADGCRFLDSLQIASRSDDEACRNALAERIFLPTGFTPNADGTNDQFFVYPPSTLPGEFSYRIYNRWGGMVFETEPFRAENYRQHGWNGSGYGPAVYVVHLQLDLPDGSQFFFAGDLTLLR